MKNIKLLLTIVAITLLVWGCNKGEENIKTVINLRCIDFAPNSYSTGDTIKGIDVDIASQAMSEAGVAIDVSMDTSWDLAYNAILTGTNQALLTVGYSADRKDLFKWAGPTSQGIYCIFSKGKTGIGETIGIEATKGVESVAVVKDWLETTTLEELGFENLVYFDSYLEAVNAFMNDEVKSIASDIFQFSTNLPLNYYDEEAIDIVCRYRTVFYYIAFSNDVDDVVVENCQKAIDDMIKDGSTLSLTQQYMPNANSNIIPGTLQLFLEIAPPFNFFEGKLPNVTVTGSSVEIVNEIQSRNDHFNTYNLCNWVDGFNTLQYLPNSALFTTARTPEREELFQWVGPISAMKACFYTLSNSEIKIEKLEQAKALPSIATPKGWYTHEFLINNGFQNIVANSITPYEAFDQLLSGEVEALLLFDVGIDWLCDKYKVTKTDINEQLQISSDKGYIAFSLNTPASTVQQWQNNLDDMKADGSFETIWKKWYNDIEMP